MSERELDVLLLTANPRWITEWHEARWKLSAQGGERSFRPVTGQSAPVLGTHVSVKLVAPGAASTQRLSDAECELQRSRIEYVQAIRVSCLGLCQEIVSWEAL